MHHEQPGQVQAQWLLEARLPVRAVQGALPQEARVTT